MKEENIIVTYDFATNLNMMASSINAMSVKHDGVIHRCSLCEYKSFNVVDVNILV